MRIDRKVADLRGSMGFLLSVGARNCNVSLGNVLFFSFQCN